MSLIFSSRFFVVLPGFFYLYSSSLRLRYSDPDCPISSKDRSIELGSRVNDLDIPGFGGKISSFLCTNVTYLGWVEFCLASDFKGGCIRYHIPADDAPCQKIEEDNNDKFYSFKPPPGIVCFAYE